MDDEGCGAVALFCIYGVMFGQTERFAVSCGD